MALQQRHGGDLSEDVAHRGSVGSGAGTSEADLVLHLVLERLLASKVGETRFDSLGGKINFVHCISRFN